MICLRGASEVAADVLNKTASPDLRVEVVWLPILKTDNEEAAAASAGRLTDPRAHHFFNPDGEIGREAARAMRFAPDVELAWDVYLLYDPDVRWEAGRPMPPPTAWMQRLKENDPHWMNTGLLLRAIKALLPAATTSVAPVAH